MSVNAVWVSWSAPGFHRWPGASGRFDYLASRHRHQFQFKVAMRVDGDDREVEFHELLKHCKAYTGCETDWGERSCEQIALAVAAHVAERYGERDVYVDVSEDGECGATVRQP